MRHKRIGGRHARRALPFRRHDSDGISAPSHNRPGQAVAAGHTQVAGEPGVAARTTGSATGAALPAQRQIAALAYGAPVDAFPPLPPLPPAPP
ncbi:hypothetical protein I547_5256 [Mycobacterium kansasii 824]|uniref:Uncharacterized protein n=1 Tax=Mycobacterium kansasii TaxID=1768 RepID=A0A1V3XTZ2_MYCKA|nr:hypothetical protein I547_5256 [Mycobacterium kansasii 824]OOK81991.1 hypothetical protein BZL30_0159 [Mycobacterium kansasii]